MSNDSIREYWIDNLRAFSSFLVVLLHTAVQNYDFVNSNPNALASISFRFFDSVSRCAVPLFFMISGSLFLGAKKRNIKRHIIKLLVLYLSVSTLYAFIYYRNRDITFIFYSIIRGHYHLWFIPAMIYLYLVTPIIRKITDDRRITEYYLTISFLFGILIPQTTAMILRVDRYTSNHVAWAINDFIGNGGFQIISGYSFYYILGFYLKEYENDLHLSKKVIVFAGALGFAITYIYSIYDYLTINVMFVAIAVFLLFRYYGNTQIALLSYLSKMSLGIYCLHILVLDKLNTMLGINTLMVNGFISVPLITIITLAISVLLTHLIVIVNDFVKNIISNNN